MENGANINDVLSFIKNNVINNDIPVSNVDMIQLLYIHVNAYHTLDVEEPVNRDTEFENIAERYNKLVDLINDGMNIISDYKEMLQNKITKELDAAFSVLNNPTFKTDSLLLQAGILMPLKLKMAYISTLDVQSQLLTTNLGDANVNDLDGMIETAEEYLQKITNDFKIFMQSV